LSYALAAYVVVVGGVVAYGAWLARRRKQLERELAAAAERNDG
jgi:CcmD family protein